MKKRTANRTMSPWQTIAANTAEQCDRVIHRRKCAEGRRKKLLESKVEKLGPKLYAVLTGKKLDD
jgi:hypothetical protein